MLIPRPERIMHKMKYNPERGYYLTDPHTEEEQKLLDEFVKDQEKAEEEQVYIAPELLKKAGLA